MFLSYILFELLNVEHRSPYHTKCQMLFSRPCAGYSTPSPRWNFVHSDFKILHYISHKMKYVNPLRVAALACNIMLHTLPAK